MIKSLHFDCFDLPFDLKHSFDFTLDELTNIIYMLDYVKMSTEDELLFQKLSSLRQALESFDESFVYFNRG